MKKIFSILLLWLGITLGFAQPLITQDNTDGVTGSGSKAQISQYTAKGISITWDANDSKYAFDSQELTKLPKDQYPSVKNADGTAVLVPYKAVVNGKDDLISAKITITEQEILKDARIEFKVLSSGKNIEAVQSGNNYKLKLKGAYDYAEEEVVAALVPNDKEKKQQIISSFRLVHLSPKDINVSFVPLDKEAQNKLDDYGNKVNNIYQKVGINFNVRKEQIPEGFDSLNIGDRIESGDPKLMSTYGSDQLKINSLYKGTDQRYVMFVTSKQASTGADGYFRLNGQFGYVFGKAKNKTAAHELGHGVFKLEHPWEEYGSIQSNTNLLMDYSSGEILSHLDWKQINDPKFKIYAFQGQSEGESLGADGVTFILDNDENFLTPDGKVLSLPKGSIIYQYCLDINVTNSNSYGGFPNGALYGFKVGNNYYVIKDPKSSEANFLGYFLVENGQYKKEHYPIPNSSDGKKDIVFLNYTAKATEPHFVNFIKIKGFYFKQKSDNKFSYINYQDKFSASDIIESIDFPSAVCGNHEIPNKEIGKERIKNSDRKFIDSIGGKTAEEKYKIEVYKNEKTGKYEVEVELKGEAFDTKVSEQRTLIQQQIKTLAEEKLNELGGLDAKKSPSQRQETEDGGEFYVKEMNGREWIETLGNLGQNVWENAALPKSYWNKDEGYSQSNIHIPPTFAGVGDGVIEEVTEYPQLIKLGYDVSTKKEVRERLWESVKGISVETIKDASIDFYEEKKANYTSDKSYIVNHTVGKDGVQVASMLMGGGLAGGLKKGAKGVDDAVGKAGKEVLSKVSGELEDSADKLANKLVKEAVENGDLEKEIVESAKNEIKDISTKKGRKLSWEEVKDFFKRGNDFNRKVNSKVPPKYDFNEVTVEQIIDGKIRKFRLDGYNEGLEIVSRKATDFDNIKTSTFEKYCDELINKYKVGTKITAPKYPELNGKTLQGKYKLEVPKSNEMSSKLTEFKNIAKSKGIEIVFEAE